MGYDRGLYIVVMGRCNGATLDSAVMIRSIDNEGGNFIIRLAIMLFWR